MIPRIAFSSVAACLVGMAMSFTPQVAQARGHGGGFHGGGFHGGGFHGGGYRGGFYGGGLGYGGGFGRSFYGGGFGRSYYGGGYASRGFYGGYRGFYPRYYGGFYPRYYGGYVGNFGYYGAGYGGYGSGYGGYGAGYGGYQNGGYSNYGNCTCGTYGVGGGGYTTASLGGAPTVVLNSRVISTNAANSNPMLAYHLKNNPYNTPRIQDQMIVSNRNVAPAGNFPADNPNSKFFPAMITQKTIPLPPAPML